jgi:hypothetical protein
MKLLSIVFLTFISLSSSMAQFKQGTVMIGGSLSGSFETHYYKSGGTTTADYTHRSLTFAPLGGFFVANNLAVGLGMSVTTEKTDYKQTSGNLSYVSSDIGPFVRYYFHGFFVHGEFQLGTTTSRYSGSTNETQNNTSWKGGIGYAWLLNDHVAVEPLFGYGSINFKDTSSGSSYKESSPGISFQLGFQVYLNRR